MFYYIFLFIIFIILLFLLLNYYKISKILEKQGTSNIDDEYIYPEKIDNFINDTQSSNIINYASSRFSPSVVGGGLNNVFDENARNSQTAWISKYNPIVIDIYKKICSNYNINIENVEDMQVVKYEKGNYYKHHHDSFPFYEPDFLSQGGHRVLTVLIYLNDDFEGGETDFKELNQSFKPVKNSAIVFHPLDKDNKKCHPKALHAGMPVKSGTKYICNIWIREETYRYDIDTWSYDYLFNSTVLIVCKFMKTIRLL